MIKDQAMTQAMYTETASKEELGKLSPAELSYYQRQLILKEIGVAGQLKLKNASVLCVGIGGLGSPLALCLSHIGIGKIALMDGDVIEQSNLHRQLLYTTAELGQSKVSVAKAQLQAHNPHISIQAIPQHFTEEHTPKQHCFTQEAAREQHIQSQSQSKLPNPTIDEAGIQLNQYDLIIDGTDDLKTRYLLNQQSVRYQIPYLYAALDQWQGQFAIFHPQQQQAPCFECLFPQKERSPFETCRQKGMLATTSMLVATYQANLVAQHVLGLCQSYGILFQINSLDLSIYPTKIPKRKDCRCQSIKEVQSNLEAMTLGQPVTNHAMEAQVISIRYLPALAQSLPLNIIDLRDQIDQEDFNLSLILNQFLAKDQYQLLSISFQHLISHLLDEKIDTLLNRKHAYYFFCQHQQRSQLICDYLLNQGFNPKLLVVLTYD